MSEKGLCVSCGKDKKKEIPSEPQTERTSVRRKPQEDLQF